MEIDREIDAYIGKESLDGQRKQGRKEEEKRLYDEGSVVSTTNTSKR